MVHCAPLRAQRLCRLEYLYVESLNVEAFRVERPAAGEDGSMVSQPKSVNAQVAECDPLLTGCRVIDPATGLNDVADVAISGGTVVALGGPAPRAARTI
jgi:hypothetical protein